MVKIEIDIRMAELALLGDSTDEIRRAIEKLVRAECTVIAACKHHMSEFLDRLCLDEGGQIRAVELFEVYTHFCHDRGHSAMGRNTFYEFIAKLDGVHKKVGGRNVLTFHNISHPKPIEHDDDEWL